MKKIVFKTNYNQKLHCNGFIHIAPAPAGGIPESKMNQVYCIATEDNSYPDSYFRLFELIRMPLKMVKTIFTIPSHGMEGDEFILSFMEKAPGASLDSEMAIYFYVKEPSPAGNETNARPP